MRLLWPLCKLASDCAGRHEDTDKGKKGMRTPYGRVLVGSHAGAVTGVYVLLTASCDGS